MSESGYQEKTTKPKWQKLRLGVFVGVLAFSTVRVLLASRVEEFEGSIWVLWLVDVATAWPYVWGLFRLFTGKSTWSRLLGLAVALPAFLAPYLYWYLNGKGYPVYVHLVIGLFIAVAIGSELYRWYRSKHSR